LSKKEVLNPPLGRKGAFPIEKIFSRLRERGKTWSGDIMLRRFYGALIKREGTRNLDGPNAGPSGLAYLKGGAERSLQGTSRKKKTIQGEKHLERFPGDKTIFPGSTSKSAWSAKKE